MPSPAKSSSEPSPTCAKAGLHDVTVNVTIDDVIPWTAVAVLAVYSRRFGSRRAITGLAAIMTYFAAIFGRPAPRPAVMG
jgi:hypothetical protein